MPSLSFLLTNFAPTPSPFNIQVQIRQPRPTFLPRGGTLIPAGPPSTCGNLVKLFYTLSLVKLLERVSALVHSPTYEMGKPWAWALALQSNKALRFSASANFLQLRTLSSPSSSVRVRMRTMSEENLSLLRVWIVFESWIVVTRYVPR